MISFPQRLWMAVTDATEERRMKQKHVKDLMIPIDDYATVGIDATIKEAVEALQAAHEKYSDLQYKHRAVLVLDEQRNVVGKLSMHDVIVALEPAYRQLGDYRMLDRSGLSMDFINSIRESFAMWDHPMENICEKAAEQLVADVMYAPTESEHVDIGATLDEGVHQLVVGSHQSLLVMENDRIVGILRLVDVFHAVAEAIKACAEGRTDL